MATSHDSASQPRVGHVVDFKILLGIWLILMFLTFITVAATWIDMGALNLWLAMGIATVKASLVALYFMHLRYDNPFNSIVIVVSFLFVMLFIGLALMDSVAYQPDIIPGYGPAMDQ